MKHMFKSWLVAALAFGFAANAWAEIEFGDTYTFEEVVTSTWSEWELHKVNYVEMGTATSWKKVYPGAVVNQYAVFEVRGAKSKSEIRPVVENLGFKGTLEVAVWSDTEFRNKAMPPLSTQYAWESDGRWVDFREPGDISGPLIGGYNDWHGEWDDACVLEYENEVGGKEVDYEWPADVWPNGALDTSRFWVAVKCYSFEQNRWYGIDGAIRVHQSGTDAISPMVYVEYDTDDAWPFSTSANGLFRGLTITTAFTALCPDLWDAHKASYDAPLHAYWLETSWNQCGGPLQVKLPEAGILYLATDWAGNMWDVTIANANKVTVNDIQESDPEVAYFEYGALPYPYSQPRVIAAKVNSARTVTISREEEDDDDYDFNRLQFFPSSKKAVAVEASFFSIFDKNIYNRRSDDVGHYLQGYVTGTGVYKVGETVALTAVPAPGEAFDHWELCYGNFPNGIDTTKATLNFTVTDACAGTAEERKQMVVRAVWKEKQQLIATTADLTKGAVSGSGFYHSGTAVTLKATSSHGYVFGGWFSDENCTMPITGNQDYLNRICQYTIGDEDTTIYAKFEEDVNTLQGVSLGDPMCFWVDPADGEWSLSNGAAWIDCWADGEDWAVVPISGVSSTTTLEPVVVFGSADSSMVYDIGIMSDAALKARMKGPYRPDFEVTARTTSSVISSIESSVADSTRKWLVVKIKAKIGAFQPKTFFVGLKGGNEYRKFVIVKNGSDGAIEDGFDNNANSETVVLPVPVGYATVSGNGTGVRNVTVMPISGYAVTGWSDDEMNKNKVRQLQPNRMPYFVNLDTDKSNGMCVITFYANGGKVSEAFREVANGAAIGALPTPVRELCQFDGWYTEASGGTKVTDTTKVTSDIAYYAHWLAKVEPLVAKDCEGMGTVSGGGVTAIGGKTTVKATPASGCLFEGWYDDNGGLLSTEKSYQYTCEGEGAKLYARFVKLGLAAEEYRGTITFQEYEAGWQHWGDVYEGKVTATLNANGTFTLKMEFEDEPPLQYTVPSSKVREVDGVVMLNGRFKADESWWDCNFTIDRATGEIKCNGTEEVEYPDQSGLMVIQATSLRYLPWSITPAKTAKGGWTPFYILSSPDGAWQFYGTKKEYTDSNKEHEQGTDFYITYKARVNGQRWELEDCFGASYDEQPIIKGSGVLTLPTVAVAEDEDNYEYRVGVDDWSMEGWNKKTAGITKIVMTEDFTGFFGEGNTMALSGGGFEVAEGNERFYSDEKGILYVHGEYPSDGRERLLAVPSSITGTYVIPEAVQYVQPGAFEKTALSKIVINSNLEEFGSDHEVSTSLKEINCAANDRFIFQNGILYEVEDENNWTALMGLGGVLKGSVTIPSNVTRVAPCALAYSTISVKDFIFTSPYLELEECALEESGVSETIDFSRVGQLVLTSYWDSPFGETLAKTIKFPANTQFADGILDFDEAKNLIDIYWPTTAGYDESGLDEIRIETSKAVKLHVMRTNNYWPSKLGKVTVAQDLCTVYFDLNDDNGEEAECDEEERMVVQGQTVGTLPVSTRGGTYQFDGWYTAAKGGTKISNATKVTDNTIYYAHWSAMITPQLIPGCDESMGSVSAGVVVAAGKTTTIKATPKANYVFAGWHDENLVPLTGGGDYRNPSYTYTSTGEPTELYARFVPASDDKVIAIYLYDDETEADGTYVLDLVDKVVSESLPKITVSGLPNGIKFDSKTNKISGQAKAPGKYKVTVSATNATVKKADPQIFTLTVPNLRPELFDYEWLKDNYSAIAGVLEDSTALLGGLGDLINDGWSIKVSGLPTGMSYKAATKTQPMAITGTATKEGDYTMYIEASKKGVEKQTATATISVSFPMLTVVSENEDKGTVTGGGKYQAGKKVTLKATAKKGYVFAGWYVGDDPLEVEGGDDYRKASYNYTTTTEAVTITGKFVTVDEDKLEEKIILHYEPLELYAAYNPVDEKVVVESCSLPSVSVANLPTGMKFDAKTMKITGAPSKQGEQKDVMFTIKNESNKTGKQVVKTMRVGDAVAKDLDLLYNKVPGVDGYDLLVPGAKVDKDLLGMGDKLVGWSVSGLPAGVKFDSKTGEFSGAATKSGTKYLVTLTKGSGATKQTATITLETKPDPKLVLMKYLMLRGDDDKNEAAEAMAEFPSVFVVSGGGNYPVGKKVTISATAPEDWVFLGWMEPYDCIGDKTKLMQFAKQSKCTIEMPTPDENNEVRLLAVFTYLADDIEVYTEDMHY